MGMKIAQRQIAHLCLEMFCLLHVEGREQAAPLDILQGSRLSINYENDIIAGMRLISGLDRQV